MHSKIIEIVHGLDMPIPENEWAKTTDLPEHFVGDIAEYTDDISGRYAEEIKESFVQSFEGHCVQDGNWITFDAEAKKVDQMERYHDFIEKAKAISAITFDEFCGFGNIVEMDRLLWELNDRYSDKFSLYIYDSKESVLLTIDDWKRKLRPDERYFMGGVMDYHW